VSLLFREKDLNRNSFEQPPAAEMSEIREPILRKSERLIISRSAGANCCRARGKISISRLRSQLQRERNEHLHKKIAAVNAKNIKKHDTNIVSEKLSFLLHFIWLT